LLDPINTYSNCHLVFLLIIPFPLIMILKKLKIKMRNNKIKKEQKFL
jgi:hypothetical protein